MEQNMVVIRDPKTFSLNFDWPRYVDENFKHEIEFIIRSNKSLADNKIKNEIEQLLLKFKHGNNLPEHSKTNELHKFVLNLSQTLDLKSSNKHVALQNVSIYYTWKNIRKQYKNNILKIIAPTWNDEFELTDGSYSVSDIQDYIKYIITNYETLTAIPPFHVFINRINNRLVFKIKDEYKLELQTPKTIKLFCSTKILLDKTKNGENVPSLKVAEEVLVQGNLVDNQQNQISTIV